MTSSNQVKQNRQKKKAKLKRIKVKTILRLKNIINLLLIYLHMTIWRIKSTTYYLLHFQAIAREKAQARHTQGGFPISMTYCEKSILFNFNIYHVTQQMKFYILGDSMCRGLGPFNYNFRSHSLSFINDFMFNIEPFTITTVYGGHKISLITKKLRRNL